MELIRKIALAILPILCLSCKTTMGPIAMQEIKPLPREVVIATPIEYDPIYAVLKIREVAEENGVQKYLYAKLDGTAKGGIAVAIHSELGIPVKYIGVGETIEDLQKFDSNEFVNALFDVKDQAEQ